MQQVSQIRHYSRVYQRVQHYWVLQRRKLRLLLPLVQLQPTLALALALAHTTYRATHHHLSPSSSILVVRGLTGNSGGTFFQFLFFEFDILYFLVNFVYLVSEFFLYLLCLLELLFNDKTVVSLKNLFVHKIAPRARVHLVVKVVLIKLILCHLAEAAEGKIN